VQVLVDMWRRPRKPRCDHDLAQVEGVVGLVAGCLDRDRGWAADVLPLTGLVYGRASIARSV
jgi:hypothetical protein